MKYLIAALGNIGPEYELTRHNIGFLVADRLADRQGATFQTGRLAFEADFRYKSRQVQLIKPTTYMNLSGRAVQHWLSALKVPAENLLVVTDDLAIDYGRLRLRQRGSHGGHNGLRHIQETLGHANYARLRCGIGSNFSRGRQVDYVLSRFDEGEMAELTTVLDRAADAILSFCTIGAARTMNEFN